ncbi:MAG: dTMP kinase, partial [Candidatus Aminicenantaceae bacterium]
LSMLASGLGAARVDFDFMPAGEFRPEVDTSKLEKILPDPDQIRETNASFAVPPDLVFILDVNPARGLKRTEGRQQRDLLFEREDYLVKVRAIFQGLEGDEFFHLDALRPMEGVAEDVTQITLDFLSFFTIED